MPRRDSAHLDRGSDAVRAFVGGQRYTVPRTGEVTSVQDASGAPSVLARPLAGGSPSLSAAIVEGRLVLRREAGAELTLTFVAAHPMPLSIARAGERFWAPVEVRPFVHQQVSPFDALTLELPSDGALDPQLMATFMAGAR